MAGGWTLWPRRSLPVPCSHQYSDVSMHLLGKWSIQGKHHPSAMLPPFSTASLCYWGSFGILPSPIPTLEFGGYNRDLLAPCYKDGIMLLRSFFPPLPPHIRCGRNKSWWLQTQTAFSRSQWLIRSKGTHQGQEKMTHPREGGTLQTNIKKETTYSRDGLEMQLPGQRETERDRAHRKPCRESSEMDGWLPQEVGRLDLKQQRLVFSS